MERLSDEDVAILRLERGNVRGHTCKVAIVREALTVEQVRAQIERRLDAAPRLRQRLVETPLHLANPCWAEDPSFEIENHVVKAAPAEPLDFDATRALVGHLMADKLPRDRPLWRIDVVERLTDGGGALIIRLHHAMSDGAASVRILRGVLFDGEVDAEPPRASSGSGPAPGAARLAALGARDRADRVVAGAGGVVRSLTSPSTWREGALEAARLPTTLAREFGRSDSPSPLDAKVGTTRAIGFASAPLERLRQIGKALEQQGTINDVVLSAVAGGLRRWLAADDAPLGGMRAQVPVSLHRPDEPPGVGNRDSFMAIDLPLPEPDPVARLRAIVAETRDRKARHDPDTLDRFFHDLGHISHRLERSAQHWAMDPRVAALSISNVPGPRGPQAICGSPLVELYSMSEVANRHALRASAISAGDRLSFTLCVDPEVVPDPMQVARGIEAEVAALDAALVAGRA